MDQSELNRNEIQPELQTTTGELLPPIMEIAKDIFDKIMPGNMDSASGQTDEKIHILDKINSYVNYDFSRLQNDEVSLSLYVPAPHDGLTPPPPTPISSLRTDSNFDLNFAERIHEAVSEVLHNSRRESTVAENEKEDSSSNQMNFNNKSIEDEEERRTAVRLVVSNHAEQERHDDDCSRYAGVEKFANKFIDSIIGKSINDIIQNKNTYLPYEHLDLEEEVMTLSSFRTYVEIFGALTRWPRIEEFTQELGETFINDYMSTWDYEEDWLYCIDFLIAQSDECSDYYLYEAKWSIPSHPYPILQATASIYFTVEVSRVKPHYCPVDVTYVFEGSRMVHTAGKIPFQEHWLFSIIDAKLEMYRKIQF